MKNRFSLIAIWACCFCCAIIVLMFAACNRGSPRTEGSAQSQDVNFSVNYIQDADMSRLANRNIIGYGTAGEKIIIFADVDLSDFKIYSIGTDSEDNSSFIENTVFSLGVLQSNSAIEYSTYIPEGMPAEALSFKTPDGETHTYKLGVSGTDGKVALSPWSIPSQSAAGASVSYAEILNGDFSEFAGTWVNEQGGRVQLRADGTFGEGRAGNVTKAVNGIYMWPVATGEESGFGAALYPAGNEVWNEDGQLLATDTTKVRITIGYVHSITNVYYREGEYTASQNTSAALEHEELRIGSSVSGVVGGDWKENYNIRSFEKGYILLEIESDAEIYLEVYNGQQFITTNMNDSDEISSRAEITAQPNTVYLLTVQSYVRDVKEAGFRITASFDR